MTPLRETKQDDRPAVPPPIPPRQSIPPSIPPFRSVSMSVMAAPSSLQQLTHLRKQQAKTEWIWKLSEVSPVPLYHPLERTSISSTESLDIITERISHFMKAHSIKCSYHDQLARVDCSTDELVHFVVQLWKKNNATTIIEVQRRQGCAISMQTLRQQLAQTILHGDDYHQQPKPPSHQRACAAFLQHLPMEQQQMQTSTTTSTTTENCHEQCLELCQQLLKSDLLDQNRLGLESLCILTDPSKVLKTDAEETSRRLLEDEQFQNLLTKFFVTDNDDDVMMDYDERTYGALHLLALKALSHAMETTVTWQQQQQQQQKKRLSIDLSSFFWKTILQADYKNIQLANERPIEASLSIRFLRLLQTLEPSALMHLQQQQQHLNDCLQNAHEYGRQHNRSLQKETELLMMEQPMGFVC